MKHVYEFKVTYRYSATLTDWMLVEAATYAEAESLVRATTGKVVLGSNLLGGCLTCKGVK